MKLNYKIIDKKLFQLFISSPQSFAQSLYIFLPSLNSISVVNTYTHNSLSLLLSQTNYYAQFSSYACAEGVCCVVCIFYFFHYRRLLHSLSRLLSSVLSKCGNIRSASSLNSNKMINLLPRQDRQLYVWLFICA